MKQNINAPPEEDVASLVEGIVRSSAEEIRSMLAEATDYSAAKAAAAEAKAAAIMAEAEAGILEQTASIRRNADSRLALERKKADLGARDRLVREIESRARARMEDGIPDTEYRRLLLAWTVEAAIGLGGDSAVVHTCRAERRLIDDGFLREAEAEARKLCGRPVKLRPAEDGFLGDRGIELVADGGRLSYDNRINTRFSRAAGEIRSIVYKVAYGDGKLDKE